MTQIDTQTGLQSDQVREFKQLQDENARLKKLVAELSLDKAILQDVAAKNWRGPRLRGMQSSTSCATMPSTCGGPAD